MSRYVTDTHALLWQLMKSRKLSRAARRAFRDADAGLAQVLVPSIVLVEAVHIFARSRIPAYILEQLFLMSEEAEANYCVVPLDMAVARAVRDFGPAAVPEMPDRIIAATARALDVPLITVDPTIVESGLVTVVW